VLLFLFIKERKIVCMRVWVDERETGDRFRRVRVFPRATEETSSEGGRGLSSTVYRLGR